MEDFFYKIACRLESFSNKLEFSVIIELSKEFPEDLAIIPLFDVPNLVESLRYSPNFEDNLLLRIEGVINIYTEGIQCEEYSLREYLMNSLIDLSNYEKGIIHDEIRLADDRVIYWPIKPKPFKCINSRELS